MTISSKKCEGKCNIELFILPISTVFGNLQQKRRAETTAKLTGGCKTSLKVFASSKSRISAVRTSVVAYMDATPLSDNDNANFYDVLVAVVVVRVG